MTTMIIITTCAVFMLGYALFIQVIHKKLKFITPFLFLMGQSFKEMVQGKKKMNPALKIAIRHYFWMRKIFYKY